MEDYIVKEFKKLFPVGVFLVLLPMNISLGLSLVGIFLLAEHMYTYGRWNLFDILGHETLGIILLLIGLSLMGNWLGFFVSLVTYLIFSNYTWENPIKYFKEKFI